MARHRNSAARRGVSRGPIIVLVVIVVIALAIFGWLRVQDRIGEQRNAATARCISGPATLNVIANDAITPALTEIAQRYTASRAVIRDHCIEVTVRTAGDRAVLAGLTGDWDQASMGKPPAVWIPQDSTATARLAASKPTAIADKKQSVAQSPLVLAVPQPVADSMTAAKLSWAALPQLQAARDGWARLGQPGWGTSTIALPSGKDGSSTSALAVQAVAAGISGTAPVTKDSLEQPAVKSALAALRQGPQPGSTIAALAAIHGLSAVAASPYQAVPATEQEVFTAAAAPGDTPLAGVPLVGPTPMADYPFTGISAPWVDDTQSRAAGAFAEFLRQPAQQKVLAGDGFHAGEAALPTGSPAVSFTPVATTLPPADAEAGAALDQFVG